MDSDILLAIMAIVLVLIFIGVIFYIPITMAKSRGRSIFAWLLFSIIFSPILTIIILFFMGDTDKNRLKKIKEEEELRISIRQKLSDENKD